MAPSRGIHLLPRFCLTFLPLQRNRPRSFSSFASGVSNPTSTHQIYISRSHSPFVNLSIEHFLLQKTPSNSTILFLYSNSPSIILGRNQNPWVEANLGLLSRDRALNHAIPQALRENPPLLVRRRSGGGTVFHDHGNVNYSVITPTANFCRDKHASMIVRALCRLGITHARVNERHDIVLVSNPQSVPRKISGSAYKLTRQRSLHHGTCLLSSPYLATIPLYLHSPAKAYIRARGVESVSSPVANVGVGIAEFVETVVAEFMEMYEISGDIREVLTSNGICEGQGWRGGVIGEEDAEIGGIAKGVAELKSSDWIYAQTPQFTFSSHATPEDPRIRPALPTTLPLSKETPFHDPFAPPATLKSPIPVEDFHSGLLMSNYYEQRGKEPRPFVPDQKRELKDKCLKVYLEKKRKKADYR